MPARLIVAILPVRSFDDAKTRLAERLDSEERAELVTTLLLRTIAAAAPSVERVVVVSPDADVLRFAEGAGAEPLRQVGGGLNDALEQGHTQAVGLGATALLVLPPDLATIEAREVRRIVAAAAGHRRVVVLVPDRHGTGTNALLVAPPDVIGFQFGPDSRRAHAEAARAAGATLVELDGPLGLDVDTPEDLLLAEAHLAGDGP